MASPWQDLTDLTGDGEFTVERVRPSDKDIAAAGAALGRGPGFRHGIRPVPRFDQADGAHIRDQLSDGQEAAGQHREPVRVRG